MRDSEVFSDHFVHRVSQRLEKGGIHERKMALSIRHADHFGAVFHSLREDVRLLVDALASRRVPARYAGSSSFLHNVRFLVKRHGGTVPIQKPVDLRSTRTLIIRDPSGPLPESFPIHYVTVTYPHRITSSKTGVGRRQSLTNRANLPSLMCLSAF